MNCSIVFLQYFFRVVGKLCLAKAFYSQVLFPVYEFCFDAFGKLVVDDSVASVAGIFKKAFFKVNVCDSRAQKE